MVGSLLPAQEGGPSVNKSVFADVPESPANAVSRERSPDGEGEIYLDRKNQMQPTQWGMVASNGWKSQSTTQRKLPSGEYTIAIDGRDDRPVFFKKETQSDDLIRVGGGLPDQVFREIKLFWEKGAAFKKAGFLHRRGYMFYGPQGSGKTSIIRQISQSVVKQGGIVFYCTHPGAFSLGLEAFRQVEPDRPIVCIFEDIDALIKRFGEEEILQLLDGANQVNRVLNISSTNYPELLDKRIVSRPRRFDRLHRIVAPDEKTRRQYLILKLGVKANINKWIEATKGLSFASLTEAVISVTCLGHKLEDAVAILRKIEEGKPSSEEGGAFLGFGTSIKKEPDEDE